MVEGSRGELAEFNAEVDGFSGPFDALCWLVESRELEASSISVRQVVRIYGSYLANTNKVPVTVVFEFILMAASLVLNKALSLMPGAEPAEDFQAEGPEEDVIERLSRYRPYRAVTLDLLALKEKRDRLFFRQQPDDDGGEPSQYLGDLYALCKLWWSLEEAGRRARQQAVSDDQDVFEWDGVPSSLPEEEQVDIKISHMISRLADCGELSLSLFLRENRSMRNLVVTIIALLEMSRAGLVRIIQRELFGDVVIVRV